ncbi:MAG: TetR/AcrR family transcriptional regulator [Anaerolineae bacterium]|nr:TetR/AcrR family transcriptional regulator [Anaerolineae bacterium]
MQKSKGIEDLRVYRTRKLLQQAFIELTEEKGFAALTVRDITERAMVNRSTFYRHYLDKYDLLDQYLSEISGLFDDREGQSERSSHEVPSTLIDLLRHMQQFAGFYRAMLGAKADPLLEQRFRQKMEKRVLSCADQARSEQTSPPGAPPINLVYTTTAAAGCSAIVWWLEHDQPYPLEHLAQWLNQFVYDLSGSSLKLNG